jgi:Arc/MetJ-type ribon-helix-helix transcriptional regulator
MNMDDKDRDDEDEDEDEQEDDEDDEDARERAEEHEAAWEEYKDALRDLKDQYQDMLEDWEAKMDDWEDQMKDRSTNGSFVHFAMPPIPPIPPGLPVPPIHAHVMSGTRANVVASRISDDDLRLMDMLLEAGIFATRSEAVAYLVSEGIKARRDMLEKVSASLEEIRATRKAAEAKIDALRQEIGIRNPPAKPAADEPPATDRKGTVCPQCHRPLPAGNVRFCPSCGAKLGE